MSVIIYPPSTAPTLPGTYADSPADYPSSASYSDWAGSGGSGSRAVSNGTTAAMEPRPVR